LFRKAGSSFSYETLYLIGKKLPSLLIGIVLGAASWFVVPLVSNKFEPFDSDTGLYIGQALMSAAAFYMGFSRGINILLIFVFGAYVGLNIYPYAFGTSEHRAWAGLGLLMSTLLCICPIGVGLLGKAASFGKMKFNNWLKHDASG
jgi:hypothetical protein